MKFLVFFLLCLIFAIEAKYSPSKLPARNCNDPIERGKCKASHQRYAYNSEKRKCERFRWGGCDANGNNFRNMAECRRTCERGQQRVEFPTLQQQKVKLTPISQKNVKLP
ncbi:Kunitz/Bovine pancreatic trypsin inhibitor domain protein [Ancylostoma caninum]|uniref:Kunitz/Bovine pancreatic trypsin inhibitor domain protein n=1 Tax=Ancylostoma caninum TaxID=29170 RepID=A0A368FKT4_ANCCA|nr:Kunitz/Bovine pancreatic trypsin inhibitor domain protein [Ancylostoma caninum]